MKTSTQVTLTTGFYMGKYEVTQEQYQAVMGSNPSFYSTANGEAPNAGETAEKRPVEQVSWYDALVFCNKLSVIEELSPAYSINGSIDTAAWGTVPTNFDVTWNAVTIVPDSNGYRLPTEAQWEYACRAGMTTAFNDGNNDYTNAAKVSAVGWYTVNSGSKTHQVGLKTANAWELYDMHGNVEEWCWDWYSKNYYYSSPANDPVGPSSSEEGRVLRGGRYNYPGQYVRSASRNYISPSVRYIYLGFRLVRPSE